MPNILVVDDSPIDRVLVEGILKREREFRVTIATSGADALNKIGDVSPDVVVTDLQMPEMDGLQLVTALKIHYPKIPVVLITAHGSEDLAMRALEQGAASYVPKSQLSDKLPEAVQHVLTLSQTDRSYERLTQCIEFADFRFAIDYDAALYQRMIELVQQIAVSMGVCDVGGQVRLGMALEEALQYMMLRGNFELDDNALQDILMRSPEGLAQIEQRRTTAPYSTRKLRINCRLGADEVRVAVRHEGRPMPPPALPVEGTSPELEAASNRSLVLMTAFLDEVLFDETATEVVLVKKRD